MLITSNRSIGEWETVFGDAVVATAIPDRLLHHSHVITIRGDSYRLREKRRTGMTTSLPRWSLRSARVPPVHYLDKLLQLSLGATPLNLGVQVLMAERVRFRTPVDNFRSSDLGKLIGWVTEDGGEPAGILI